MELKRVTGGYRLLKQATSGYKRLQVVTGGFKGLKELTRGYERLKGIQGVTKIHGVTVGSKRVQGGTGVT